MDHTDRGSGPRILSLLSGIKLLDIVVGYGGVCRLVALTPYPSPLIIGEVGIATNWAIETVLRPPRWVLLMRLLTL